MSTDKQSTPLTPEEELMLRETLQDEAIEREHAHVSDDALKGLFDALASVYAPKSCSNTYEP